MSTVGDDGAVTDERLTWVRAQIDDDERVAQMATAGPWIVAGSCSGEGGTHLADIHTVTNDAVTSAREEPCCVVEDAEHIARHDPPRALREVDAKRQRLAVIELDLADDPQNETALHLLALELLPYADRPGYRDEWRP